MKKDNEKIFAWGFLLVTILTFFFFGFYHLTKFDTTDEQLWRYGRIKQYWQALEKNDWLKTYINDKPGVTIALFSGAGLLFEPNPESHKLADPEGLFLLFDTAKTEFLNLIFRLPVLLVSSFSLLLFFWLTQRTFLSRQLAIFTVFFLALNPIILGMSQIVNPDSYLWVFGGLSVFSYLALLNTREKKFLVLAAIFAGLAMLSKYTAITLFLFYFLALLGKIIFQNGYFSSDKKPDYSQIFRDILHIGIIFISSLIIFSILLPAVFAKPALLTKGISQFFSWTTFLSIATVFLLIGFVFVFKRSFFDTFLSFLVRQRKSLLIFSATIFCLVLIPLLLNVWTNQHLAPLDQLRDASYANEPKKFNFGKTLLKDNSPLEKNSKLLLMEFYPFIFSLTPLTLFLIVFLAMKIFKKRELRPEHAAAFFSIILFFILYFCATLFTKVITNVRYSIILYPLFSLLTAMSIQEILENSRLKKINPFKLLIVISSSIFIVGFFTLWNIRPQYFNYANFLLPKKFTISQSWGHGSYEAAQYLNSLPDSQNLIVWSNSDTICYFLKGKCLANRKIDLNRVTPDYFIISKRGELKMKNWFTFINSEVGEKNNQYYFNKLKDGYVWQILLDDRPENYVKIIKFEK